MSLYPTTLNLDISGKDLDIFQLPNFMDDSLDEELFKSVGQDDVSSWLAGSDFDLLLGGQACGSKAASLDAAVKQDLNPQSPTIIEATVSQSEPNSRGFQTAALQTSWGGFPSALFSNLPSVEAALRGAESSAQQPAASAPQSVFQWQGGATGEVGVDRTDGFKSRSVPREDSTGSSGIDIPAAKGEKTSANSPGRSSSWKSAGMLKSKRSRPKQRGQVAELKEKVAELTAKCTTMERQLSSQSLNRDSLAHSPSAPAQLQSSLLHHGMDHSQPVTQGSFPPQLGANTSQDAAAQASEQQQLSLNGITCEEFGKTYQQMVSQLAVRLMASPKDEEASEELKKMSSDVLLLVMRCCMENSVVAKMWMLETFKAEQERLEADQDGTKLWETTAKSLALSAEQKQAVVQLRHAFLQRLEGLQRARRDIIAGLTGSAPSSFRHRASAVAQLQGLQRIEAYCSNMKECDRLICDYVVTFHSQILLPTQFARCLVAAYPFWPDTLALGTYIAADAGERSAMAMLQEQFRGVSVAAGSS